MGIDLDRLDITMPHKFLNYHLDTYTVWVAKITEKCLDLVLPHISQVLLVSPIYKIDVDEAAKLRSLIS